MKKTFTLLFTVILCVILLSACKNEKGNDMFNYKSGVYHDKNWGDSVGTYKKDVISDEKCAVAVATEIFNCMEKSKALEEYKPQSVFYDEKDEIWIVSFWKDSDEITLGGDCNIAMQKKDGKVLRIWFGE